MLLRSASCEGCVVGFRERPFARFSDLLLLTAAISSGSLVFPPPVLTRSGRGNDLLLERAPFSFFNLLGEEFQAFIEGSSPSF